MHKVYLAQNYRGNTIEFIEAAVERMFSADEVTSVVDPAKLKRLKHQMVSLFLKL